MPLHGDALLKAAVMVAEVEEMQVSVKNTFAASAVTAVAGTGGFLLLGPAGLFVGSTLAGLGAYTYTKNRFKPVFAILKEDLRPQQQEELLELLRKTFADVDHMDFVKLYMLMMNKQEMWARMRDFLMMWMVEYFMKALAVYNVKVEVKQMTDVERYRKFTEEFKRRNGLPGSACPPAIGAGAGATAGSGWVPDVTPGWPDFAAGSDDVEPRLPVAADADKSAPGWRPDFAAGSDDVEPRLPVAADADKSAPGWRPDFAARAHEATAPALLHTPLAETSTHDQPNLASASDSADPEPSEENRLPSTPKTALKTTF